MKHGRNVLSLVGDAMAEGDLWRARNDTERAADAKRIADALNIPERDRAILGI